MQSSSAKAKIKSFYRKQMKDDNIRMGRAMFEEAAKRKGYTAAQLLSPESFKIISDRYLFDTQDEMFASIGCGSMSVNQVIFKLCDYLRKTMPPAVEVRPFRRSDKGSVRIENMDGLLVSFAGCCSPVPGDDIVGFVTRGRGIVVHRRDCANMRNAEPERLQPAEWVTGDGSGRYKASIVVYADDQKSAISAIVGSVAEMKLEITSINGRYDKNNSAVVDVSVSLTNTQDVEVLIKKIRAHEHIFEVRRDG